MTISFTTRVQASPHALRQELAGEAVFLQLNQGRYFSIDTVGSRMWKLLTSSGSVQGAYERLLVEYDVPAERLRQDLVDLLDKLVQHELVEICDS